MGDIDYGQSCPLVQYLEEVSMLENGGRIAQFAGALLVGLGYPLYIQPPDIKFNTQLVAHIRQNSLEDLLFISERTCAHCPQFDRCQVGPLFQSR